MNKKKVTCSALAALMIAGTTSFPALAAMPKGTVVIGEKAFALDYANEAENKTEMMEQIKAIQTTEGKIFVKAPNGVWFNNDQSKLEDASVIPAVTYKDAEGEKSYESGDGEEANQGDFKVVEISAIGAKKIQVNFNKPVEDTGKLSLKIKRDGITVKTLDDKNEWNEEMTSVVLTASYYLQDGKYVVEASYDEAEATTSEAEIKKAKLSTIEFVGENAVIATKDNKTVKARVKLLNQYGEDWSKLAGSVTVYASPSNSTSEGVTYSNGVITIKYENGFRIDENVVVNIFHQESGTSSHATLKVAQSALIESIELGEVTTDNKKYKDKDIYVSSLKNNSDGYYIPIVAKDQYGNVLTADELNGHLIAYPNTDGASVFIDSEVKDGMSTAKVVKKDNQLVLNIKPGKQIIPFNHPISVYSSFTGKNAKLELPILADGKIDTLTLEHPGKTVKKGVEIEIPFTSVSQYGEALVSSKDLKLKDAAQENQFANEIKFADGTVVNVFGGQIKAGTDYGKDGARTITLKAEDNTINSTIRFNVMTAGGKNGSLTLTSEAAPVPVSIDGVSSKFKTLMENTTDLTQTLSHKRVTFLDQYGEKISLPEVKSDNKVNYKVKVASDFSNVTTTGSIVLENKGDASEELKFTPKSAGKDDVKLQLVKIENGKETILDENTISMQMIELSDIDSFDVEFGSDNNKLFTGIRNANTSDDGTGKTEVNETITYSVIGKKDDKKVALSQDGTRISPVITEGLNTDTKGKVIANAKIDTDSKDKTAKLTVIFKAGTKTERIAKDVIINNATPKATVFEVQNPSNYKEISDPVITIAKDKLDGTLITKYAGDDEKNANFVFYIEDQYGVEMPRYCTVTVSGQKDKDGKAKGVINVGEAENNKKIVLTDSAASGDSFELTVVTKNGTLKSLKIIIE
jgi:hypothetical protein